MQKIRARLVTRKVLALPQVFSALLARQQVGNHCGKLRQSIACRDPAAPLISSPRQSGIWHLLCAVPLWPGSECHRDRVVILPARIGYFQPTCTYCVAAASNTPGCCCASVCLAPQLRLQKHQHHQPCGATATCTKMQLHTAIM
jgi:hypothetical protein